MGNDQFAMESLRIALAAVDHRLRAAARRNAHQDALLCAERRGDAILLQVSLKLMIHHVGGEQQCDLAQFGELVRKPRGVARDTLPGMAEAHFGWSIHHHNFVRSVQETLRYGLCDVLAGNLLHLTLQLGNVLNVDGGDHGDTGVE